MVFNGCSKVFLNRVFNIFIIFLFLSQMVYSADSYKVNNGASQVINEHGVRKNVVNNCANPILVPTKTSTEWVSNFIPNKPGCVGVYCPSGDSCAGTTDCDVNDNYYRTGTQSATSTSYCKFENYNDVSNVCNGVGGCVSGTCNSVSTTNQATAGACKYISGCSGSTPGTVSNYGSGTACSGTTDCDTNNYFFISGSNSATSTSTCRFRDYADVSNVCNGAGSCVGGSCSSYSDSTTATAGACKYISGCSGSSPGTVSNYGSGTACSGTTDCDTNNYYRITGSQGASSTSYCTFRDYADVSNVCNGAGSCVGGSCSSYSDSTQATAGTCKYISSCSGSSPGTVSNYGSGTACSGTTDCDTNDRYYISGTQSATTTSYCKFENYADVSNVCNGAGSCTSGTCNSVSTTNQATAGTCKYITSCSGSTPGSVANYGSSTTCSGVQDCDNNNYYYRTGTQSATSTSYCYYRDYADRNRYCNGAGSCAALSCSSYSNSLRNTAGTCKYISSCSGSSPGSVSNYADGTSCGSGKECLSGNCVDSYTYSWKTGSYGGCSVTGCTQQGTKTRSVWCERSDGQTVSDSYCVGTKPSTTASCWGYSCPSGRTCNKCEPHQCHPNTMECF